MSISELLPKKGRRFLSIDFGQAYLKIVYGKCLQTGFELLNYDIRRLLFGGEKKGEIIDFISNFLTRNAIDEQETFLTVSDVDSITIKHLTLPVMPASEIPEAIQWYFRAETLFSRENALLDWHSIREFVDDDGARKSEIVCVFARNISLEKHLSILKDCGLKPLRISGGPFNYAHILSHLKHGPEAVAVFDMGFKDSTLCIFKNNRLHFIRNLAFTSDKLTQSLTGTLVTDKGKVELSYEKAEEIKREFGVPMDESRLLSGSIHSTHLVGLMRPFLEGLTREIRISLDYYAANFKDERPSVVYFTGGGANIRNLAQYLAKELDRNVCILPIPDAVVTERLERTRLHRDQNQLINAVGGALTDSRSVDLTPVEVKIQHIEEVERFSLKFGALVIGGIFLLLFLVVKLQAYEYRAKLASAGMHAQALSEVGSMKQAIDSRLVLMRMIRKHKAPVGGLLRLFSSIVPSGVTLTGLSADQDTHMVLVEGGVAQNFGHNDRALTEFIEKLETSPFFSEVDLVYSRNTQDGQEFQIRCALVY